MSTLFLHFQMLGFWHPGTGRGAGPGADALANRTASGLPYLPGKTVKGLLRDAAMTAQALGGLTDPDVCKAFGSAYGAAGAGARDEARFASVPGALRFGSAHVGATRQEVVAWETWANDAGNAPGRAQMFRSFASTRIDSETGVAEHGSLRTIEVVVPLTLIAEIATSDAELARRVLAASVSHVFAVGAHRTRGLGRCVVTVVEVP
ncbi:hypothetical protein LBMAG42_56580 [Deltaproteobacteria bacterium]|nr:hypothetical protein LBMAG42_56580 [Deltaproteobacteria bacterium]